MRIGDKVVCIRSLAHAASFENIPLVGEIYTVRDIATLDGQTGIWLMEIVNPPCQYKNAYGECNFDVRNFREIDYSFGESIAEIIEYDMKPKRIMNPY